MKRSLHHVTVMCGRQAIGTRGISVTFGNRDTGSVNARGTTSLSRPGLNATIDGNWNADVGTEVIAMATAFQTLLIVHQTILPGAEARARALPHSQPMGRR